MAYYILQHDYSSGVQLNMQESLNNPLHILTVEDNQTDIKQHTKAELSHGLCNHCTNKLYPEVASRIIKK